MSRYSDLILSTSGLVAYYRLGETSATTAVDAKSGLNGTYTGNYTLGQPGLLAGDADTAVRFNGSGYVNGPTTLPQGNTSLSLSAWAFLTGGGDLRFVAAVDGDSGRGWCLFWDPNINAYKWALRRNSDDSYAIASNVQLNTLYHVVGTYDASTNTQAIYLNGVAAQSFGTGGPLDAQSPTPFQIGARQLSASRGFFAGLIDDVSVFGRALTPAEIMAQYAAGTTASSLLLRRRRSA